MADPVPYPFQKRVQAGRLTEELRVAIPAEAGQEVIVGVNSSSTAPYKGAVLASRTLTTAEQAAGQQVVQNHDATEPDGSLQLRKAAKEAATTLVDKAFSAFTTADIKTCLALLCATQDAVKMVGDVAVFKMPPENPLLP